jgi:serine/threonine protein kinase
MNITASTQIFACGQTGRRVAVSLGSVIGSGGAGTVYRDGSDPQFAIKLYDDLARANKLRPKLELMIRNPVGGLHASAHGKSYIQLAWPTEIIERPDGQIVGIRMPYLPAADSDDLEFLLRPHTRLEHKLDARFELRIIVACNLSALIEKLHIAGYCMPDLKPTNIRIYRDSGVLAVFDCDGLSLIGVGGKRFLSSEATPEYMAPEAKGDPAAAAALEQAQDRFALAVTIFQLMNEGLHPFQGIPVPGVSVPHGNQQRIDLGLYPHGKLVLANLKPNPQSLHPWFETETLSLFERAFALATIRPAANEWSRHLREMLPAQRLGLEPCSKGMSHLKLSKGCGHCELKRKLGHYPWDVDQTTQIAMTPRAKAVAAISSISATQTPSPHQSSSGSPSSGLAPVLTPKLGRVNYQSPSVYRPGLDPSYKLILLGTVAILGVGGLWFLNGSRDVSVPSPPNLPIPQPKQQAPSPPQPSPAPPKQRSIVFHPLGPQTFPSPSPAPVPLGREPTNGWQTFSWRGGRWVLPPPPSNTHYHYLCDVNARLMWCSSNPPNSSARPCNRNTDGQRGWCWEQ